MRLYAQGHISEDELSVYLADLKNQIGNLGLLLESVEAHLLQHAEKREISETTSTWLATLRERNSEVETETDETLQEPVSRPLYSHTQSRDAEVLIAVAQMFRTSFKQIREALPGTYPFCGVLTANCVINSGGGIRKLQAKGEICGSAKSR